MHVNVHKKTLSLMCTNMCASAHICAHIYLSANKYLYVLEYTHSFINIIV